MQPSLQGAHWPVATCPYWPLGQKVVQLLASKKGAPEEAGHEVHAVASIGAEHAEHAWSQGLQKPVALGENPAGQPATQVERCISGAEPDASHDVQLASSGPSHVAQLEWHVAQVLVIVLYCPELHAVAGS